MYTTLGRDELIHWGRDEINVILQTTFSNAFSWMKMYGLHVKFNWSLLPKVKLTIFKHWFRKWLRKAIIWTNDDYFIWVTRYQWVKATFECWMRFCIGAPFSIVYSYWYLSGQNRFEFGEFLVRRVAKTRVKFRKNHKCLGGFGTL